MFISLRRAISATVIAGFALTGLTATSASAVDESLTVGTSITVDYGHSVDVPFTLTTAATELLTANIQVNSGVLDMQSYIDAHPGLLYNWGGGTSWNLNVTGTPSEITDLAAHIRVKSQKNGATDALTVTVNVNNAVSPSIDPATGHAYAVNWNAADYLTSVCRAKYLNADVSYDEQQAPSGDHCYVSSGTLYPRTYQGVTGHLLQPNSQAENDFIYSNMWGNYYTFWLGASDRVSDGHWKWEGGADNGVEFWTGDSSGAAVNGAFTRWAAGYPIASVGSGDQNALQWNYGEWISADYSAYNYQIVEFDLPSGATTSLSTNLYASATVNITGVQFDTCLDVSDGFIGQVTTGGTNQAARFDVVNAINYQYVKLAKNLSNLKQNTSYNNTDQSNVGFDASFAQQTGVLDATTTCFIKGSDGSVTLRADYPTPFTLGNGLTVKYETKFLADGATVRQTVTYTNPTGSTRDAGTVKFAGAFTSNGPRHIVAEDTYGSSYAESGRGGLSLYWGGNQTTVVSASKFTPLNAADGTKWKNLNNESNRFDSWKNIPNAYFDGVEGTVANWGSNSVPVTVNSRPGTDGFADVSFSLGNIPAGQSRSVVVLSELHDLGVINTPRYDNYTAAGYQDVSRGHAFATNYGMQYGEGIYTYEVTNGSLPTGLSLNSATGQVSGVTNDPVGEVGFDITATPIDGYPELGSQTRTFWLNLVDDVADNSFEAATIAPWNILTEQIDLGETYIAGCRTVDTSDYSTLEDFSGGFDSGDAGVVDGQRGGTEDNSVGSFDYLNFWVNFDQNEKTDGNKSLHLRSQMNPTEYGYDVVHGPAIFSEEFTGNTNQVYAFDWKAIRNADSYAIFGYLLNVDTCAQTEVIDSVGDNQPWSKAFVQIPANGTYRFVFVAGTYDKSGGQYAGADLYLDNFQVGAPQAPVWTDEVVADGVLGTEYTDALHASGFPDPIVSVVGGSLPDGLSMDTHGNITGTPTAVGTYTFKVKADNGVGVIYTTVTINITTEPAVNVHWSDHELPLGLEATTPVVDGVTAVMPGTPVYSISNGALPEGLTLDANTGAITGAPLHEGNFYFTIQATNGEDTLTWTYAGLIAPAPPVPLAAPTNGKYKWNRNNTDVTWDAAPQAVRYVVKWRGIVVCESITTSCVALGRVPNDQHVTITAYDRRGHNLTGDVTFVPSSSKRLSVTPHFANNSAALTAGDKAKLKKLASYLKKHHITKLLLIGYTDITGPVGVDPGLSLSRANAVKAYLGKFMSTKNIAVKGLGRLYPAASNKTAAGRAANRRVEIWVK